MNATAETERGQGGLDRGRAGVVRRIALSLLLAGLVWESRGVAGSFEKYLWEAHLPGDLAPAARPLLTELRRQVDLVIEAGHLAPLRFSGADQVTEGFYLYTEPGRILITLGSAYPYLSAIQQTRVRDYVRVELANPAWTPWSAADSLAPRAGARREHYAMDRAWQWDWARQRAASRPRMAPLYGLWQCAWQTGDWTVVSNQWPAIRDFYDARHGHANLYGTLGAHVAIARLAHRVGDAPAKERAVARAKLAFADALDFPAALGRMRKAYARHFDGFNDRGLAAGNWLFLDLAPEVGRFLFDHLQEPVLTRHRSLVDAFPHWWVYRPWYASGWTGHESQGLPPEIVGMIFPIERWVKRARPEVLAGYQPQNAAHGIGDCHAIEALVLAIGAHGSDRWEDVRSRPDPPAATLGGHACAGIGDLQESHESERMDD